MKAPDQKRDIDAGLGTMWSITSSIGVGKMPYPGQMAFMRSSCSDILKLGARSLDLGAYTVVDKKDAGSELVS